VAPHTLLRRRSGKVSQKDLCFSFRRNQGTGVQGWPDLDLSDRDGV